MEIMEIASTYERAFKAAWTHCKENFGSCRNELMLANSRAESTENELNSLIDLFERVWLQSIKIWLPLRSTCVVLPCATTFFGFHVNPTSVFTSDRAPAVALLFDALFGEKPPQPVTIRLYHGRGGGQQHAAGSSALILWPMINVLNHLHLQGEQWGAIVSNCRRRTALSVTDRVALAHADCILVLAPSRAMPAPSTEGIPQPSETTLWAFSAESEAAISLVNRMLLSSATTYVRFCLDTN